MNHMYSPRKNFECSDFLITSFFSHEHHLKQYYTEDLKICQLHLHKEFKLLLKFSFSLMWNYTPLKSMSMLLLDIVFITWVEKIMLSLKIVIMENFKYADTVHTIANNIIHEWKGKPMKTSPHFFCCIFSKYNVYIIQHNIMYHFKTIVNHNIY